MIFNFFHRKLRIRLVDYINKVYVHERKPTSNKRHYRRLMEHLLTFEKEFGRKIYSDSFDDRTAYAWVEYLRSTTSLRKKRPYCQSTLRYFYQKTISVLYSISRSGYVVRIDSLRNIRLASVQSFAVYLSTQEVESLMLLDLPPGQAKIRDLFVVGCCTALRFSDVIRLLPENFKEDTISILTHKTKTRVDIPLHYLIRKIIQKKNGYSFLGYSGSLWHFNKTVKMVCRKAGIKSNVFVERVENGVVVQSNYEKWQLVSSHTARRTGATNMFLHGIEPYRIMMVTGHKSETSFYQYIRITSSQNAEYLKTNSFFTGLPITSNNNSEIRIQQLILINNTVTTNISPLPSDSRLDYISKSVS